MTTQPFNSAAATPQDLGRKVLEEVSSDSPNLLKLNDYILAGADLEQQDVEKMTPLLIATKRNLTGAAQMLIAAGASPCALDSNGDTPLMHAVAHENLKVIRDLQTVHAPPRSMGSSMSSEMWDRYMDSFDEKIAAAEAKETTISVLRPLTLQSRS